jgi:DNA-binding response OmpR family regulator
LDLVGNNKRVLVVDDDPDVRAILDTNLTAAGYEVKQAQDGVEALLLVTAWPPDLMVVDISMPRMDGWQLAQRVRSDPKLSAIPLVFLTGHSDDPDVLRGLTLGAVEYMTKPFRPDILVLTVAVLLNSMDGQMREERRQSLVNRRTGRQGVGSFGSVDDLEKAV